MRKEGRSDRDRGKKEGKWKKKRILAKVEMMRNSHMCCGGKRFCYIEDSSLPKKQKRVERNRENKYKGKKTKNGIGKECKRERERNQRGLHTSAIGPLAQRKYIFRYKCEGGKQMKAAIQNKERILVQRLTWEKKRDEKKIP
ncbi:hypothetical protein NPIL_9731 [Nephila pilipes]|uniref:Uncharacterized protein n=1 Tax=Nephila pilipes TaxID=299642 RepID=A0A8X6P730_NEPPI|nr:hypothetical protein NPIL_9731 [Nephila pilipes]